eukprot:Tamp_32966.p2 GENE.Tamp_32966~~Tamp_32966.p2  ORF type:complete len:106 (+),score=13.22 Tamp_32966:268-585(+)
MPYLIDIRHRHTHEHRHTDTDADTHTNTDTQTHAHTEIATRKAYLEHVLLNKVSSSFSSSSSSSSFSCSTNSAAVKILKEGALTDSGPYTEMQRNETGQTERKLI